MKLRKRRDEAEYPIYYRDNEYVFTIDRSGRGSCLCDTGARSVAVMEDSQMVIKCFLGDERACQRLLSIQDEFTVEVQLTGLVSRLIWIGQDELARYDDDDGPRRTPKLIARERRIDNALRPVIKRLFHLP